MSDPQEPQDFGAILAAFEEEQGQAPLGKIRVGDKLRGTITALGEEVAFVDLGGKSEGQVDRSELVDEDGRLTVAVGDEVEGVVAALDPSGAAVLRVRPGRTAAMRSELRQAFEQKLPVEGLVSEVIKGGVEVTIAGQRAFCPISQLADRFVDDAAEYVGRRLEFRIQRYEEKGPRLNLVVSRRALLAEEAARKADALREKLEVGAVFDGTVRSLTSYGAFVDLGGLEGLLHVREMSFERLEDPREALAEGQKVRVQVLKVEPPAKPGQSERISLSTRALEQDPWQDVETRFPVGTVVDGRVTRLEPYGAFVRLAPAIEGLIHVSKLAVEEHVRHAREVLELGQDVRVEVLAVDSDKRRISLARQVVDETRPETRDYLEKERGSEGFGSLGDFFKKSRR